MKTVAIVAYIVRYFLRRIRFANKIFSLRGKSPQPVLKPGCVTVHHFQNPSFFFLPRVSTLLMLPTDAVIPPPEAEEITRLSLSFLSNKYQIIRKKFLSASMARDNGEDHFSLLR